MCLLGLLLAFCGGALAAYLRVFPPPVLRKLASVLLHPNGTPAPAYLSRKSFFELHGTTADVVMVGDSITAGAEWPELFPLARIANRGINNDTTVGVLGRIDSIASTKATKTFVMIGVNDLLAGTTVEEVHANYLKIIQSLRLHSHQVYVQSTLLVGLSVKGHESLNGKIRSLNARMSQSCREYRGVNYIELNDALAREGTLGAAYSLDGLHLNGQGYSVWKRVLHEYLQP